MEKKIHRCKAERGEFENGGSRLSGMRLSFHSGGMVRRFFRFLGLPLVPALALLLAVTWAAVNIAFWAGQSEGERLVRNRMAQLKAQGLPVSFQALAERYHDPGLPIEENAAPLLLKAFDKLDLEEDEHRHDLRDLAAWVNEPRGENGLPFAEGDLELVATLLQRNADALALAEEAGRFAYSRFPIDFTDGHNTSAPHMDPFRQVFDLLALDVGRLVQTGRMEEAAERLEKVFLLAGLLEEDPFLSSLLTRLWGQSRAVRAIEKALVVGRFSDEQLLRFDSLAARASGLSPTPALMGEIPVIHSRSKALHAEGKPAWLGEGVLSVIMRTLVESGIYYWDHLFAIDAHRDAIALDGDIHAQMLVMQHASEGVFLPLPFSLSERMLSRTERILLSAATGQAALRMSRIAMAAERHRLRYGDLPEDLVELVPGFLPEIPADPWGGEAFSVTRDAEWVVISSEIIVGRDPGPLSFRIPIEGGNR